VDDFIGMAQGSWRHRRHVKRMLLHTLDKIFPPLDQQDNEHRQEPTSVKKMRQGDATWATRKIILGWILDTIRLTNEIHAHRIIRLTELFESVPCNQRCVSTKKWQQLAGEIHSMFIMVPGGWGLFSVLQQVLKVRRKNGTRLRLISEVHTILWDFRFLATDLKESPAHIAELIPSAFSATIGYHDTIGKGMDGIHFVPLPDGTTPLIWSSPFPTEVQDRLVSYTNLIGTIINSDLELAASVA
jgi:hypothetical protein